MAAPINHYIAISTPAGKNLRGRVVYLQPKDERWRPRSAIAHIFMIDWLDPYQYPALYITPAQSTSGAYAVHNYASEGDGWIFVGTFTATEENAP